MWLKLRARGKDGLVSIVTRLCGGKSKKNRGLIPGKGKKILFVLVLIQPSSYLGGTVGIFLGPPANLLLSASAQAYSTPLPHMLSWCAKGYPRPCQDENNRQAVVNIDMKFRFP